MLFADSPIYNSIKSGYHCHNLETSFSTIALSFVDANEFTPDISNVSFAVGKLRHRCQYVLYKDITREMTLQKS